MLDGPWADQSWGRIVDLGRAGGSAYQRWGKRFACAAESVMTADLQDYRRVRQLIAAGCGRVIDREGVDWWELMAVGLDQQIGSVLSLQKFADGLRDGDQVFATRGGFRVDALENMLGRGISRFASGSRSLGEKLRHYAKLPGKFSGSQLGEIFWDKYDGDYRIRGRFSPKRKTSDQPVVLLPSAYGNVSRMGMRYAEMLPESAIPAGYDTAKR